MKFAQYDGFGVTAADRACEKSIAFELVRLPGRKLLELVRRLRICLIVEIFHFRLTGLAWFVLFHRGTDGRL